MAGNAMSRRASYMYGNLLPGDAKGQVGAGLGTTTSAGTVTLIAPTVTVTKTGETHVIDGLTYEFLMAHGSGAPSEMLWYIKEKRAISATEEWTDDLSIACSLNSLAAAGNACLLYVLRSKLSKVFHLRLFQIQRQPDPIASANPAYNDKTNK